MTELTAEEVENLMWEMPRADRALRGTVHTGLQKLGNHKCGGLRMWPKWKSVRVVLGAVKKGKDPGAVLAEQELRKKEAEVQQKRAKGEVIPVRDEEPRRVVEDRLPGAWAMLKWRPLVSYSGHFWKGLLSMAGRWAVYAIKRLKLGLYAGSPRGVHAAWTPPSGVGAAWSHAVDVGR